jgi:hypothetical protein
VILRVGNAKCRQSKGGMSVSLETEKKISIEGLNASMKASDG